MWNIFFDVKNPDQLMLSEGKILLSPRYARWIHDHTVPLDMNVIRCFKRNPLAIDFYRFLAYRNNDLRRTISFPDNILFEQLGTEEENHRKTRMKLKAILKGIQMIWLVKAKFEDGLFELQPSPPAVQKHLSSDSKIKIIEQLEL